MSTMDERCDEGIDEIGDKSNRATTKRYSLSGNLSGCESKRSAASNRILERHDGNNRSNYYVIVDLFRVRGNGGGGGGGGK